ncbi:hypothetical protein MKZ38_008589 [Zalerion maritima]|uniref:Amino-acid transporter arg-13 n=1 Tax=Zalerion maritima TaxID=339359 RepID=A0AAD5RYF1_9PEZI|nr:hypothetical protein MKZ38_008589 [Zalerion maritima]
MMASASTAQAESHLGTPVPIKALTTAHPTTSAAMEALEDIAFGSIAGIVGKYIEYPFDTVKVRLQSQPDGRPPLYRGPIDCFKKSIKADGVIGLYRGITAPLVGAAMENSSLFFFERLGRDVVYWSGIYSKDKPLPLPALWFTGAFSGTFTSFVLTPVELVKCKIQVPGVKRGVHSQLRPLSVIRDIYRYEGIKGFWHGQLGTFLREAGGCAAWFGAKETVTDIFYRLHMRRASTDAERAAIADKPLPLWQQAIAGASAGMSYNFLFFPADTIKSRMQTTPIGTSTKNQTFLTEGAALWKEAGLKGLYRGCGITVLRSAPSSAFIFMVYDGLKRHFHFA